jgi:OOP family OmpA-OmpF porin
MKSPTSPLPLALRLAAQNFFLIGFDANATLQSTVSGVGSVMRKAVGIAVLVVGVGALGWWAKGHHAQRMQGFVSGQAAQAMAGSVHGATTTVSGRDIHLSGIADGPEERLALLAALDKVPGRRVVTDDLRVLETAAPFTLNVVKDAGGLVAQGFVPTEALRGLLGTGLLETQAADLTLAAGAPAGWVDLATKGIAALAPLNKGALAMSDGTLTISGEALGPDEAAAVDAALAGLPEGAVSKDITLLDDGSPANYTLDFAAATGATVGGKLPKGLALADITAALGLPAIGGEVTQALIGAAGDAGVYAGLKDWLGRLETLTIAATPEGLTATGTVQGDVDAAEVQAGLTAGGLAATITQAIPAGVNGDTRVNAATAKTQRFMGGYWLDVPQVDPGLAGCQTASDGLLAGATVNFVSGKDELDASALRVINDLAAIMALCAETAGLKAEIGGHTDASGDAVTNLGLSQKRAIVVRRELIARGVPAAALRAQGYGADQPIADNETEEGRAKNRRTTVLWSE